MKVDDGTVGTVGTVGAVVRPHRRPQFYQSINGYFDPAWIRENNKNKLCRAPLSSMN